MSVLTPYFARNSLNRLTLTDSIRQHVNKLLELAEPDHHIRVARIHEELFPLSTPASANAALNRLINTLNEVAKKQGIAISAAITPGNKAAVKNRWVWFKGAQPAPAPAHTSELRSIPQDQVVADQRGTSLGEPPVVVLITFNSHETAAVVRQFHPDGQPPADTPDRTTYNLLGIHGGMRIVHRVSRQGEGEAQNATHDAIKDWKPRAILGVGIAFGVNERRQTIGDVLISENIRGYELGRVNSDGTLTPRGDKPPASPTLFQRFNHLNQTCQADPNACLDWPTIHTGTLLSGNELVDNLDYRNSLLKLEPEAIGGEMEAVGIQLAAGPRRVDWLIVKAICDWGDGNKGSSRKEQDQQLAAANAALVVHRALSLGNLYPDEPPPGREAIPLDSRKGPHARPPAVCHMKLGDREAIPLLIEDAQGQHASLMKDRLEGAATPDRDKGVEVMAELLRWAGQGDAPPLFALLGEYGMGKTVTCQRLAETLGARRDQDPSLPLPLYFDLRHVTGLDRGVPSLRETLEECMERGWIDSGEGQGYRLENIHRWIEQGAIIILDGLDEVLVKLKEADGQVFTNNLLKLLADAAARRRAQGLNTPPLKLLISCRTQYFRTLRDQQNHFTGQERGEHRADSYRALVLLPFSEEQILRYLAAALPGSDPGRLLETIRSVHNLEELAHRPYTLRLVAEFIPEIERERLAGKTLYGVSLYRRMVQRWLERDAGKHHIRPEHKMRLAAHLAAHLWRNGSGLLPAGEIEDWFHAWLEGEPTLRRRYASLHPDQLEEDLRTATFPARQDERGGSSFRFAHSSLLEFFLADYLMQALRTNKPDHWAMARPSDETLDFLGQMLAESEDPRPLKTLQGWRLQYRPQTSELLLAYALRARGNGWPQPVLRDISLVGAGLRGLLFDGRKEAAQGHSRPLDLSGADFSGADLRQAVFDHIELEGARFHRAQLTQANFLDCHAAGSDWSESECTAAIWRNTTLSDSVWTGATGYRPQFIGTQFIGESAPVVQGGQGFRRPLLAPQWDHPRPPTHGLRFLSGHQGRVLACAWSPDGRSLLSGGDDGHLKLWDAASGELLRVHAMARRTHRGFNGHAVWEPKTNRLIEACGDIWRWLAWVGIDADGQLERLPLETFGPLPAPKQLAKASCGDE